MPRFAEKINKEQFLENLMKEIKLHPDYKEEEAPNNLYIENEWFWFSSRYCLLSLNKKVIKDLGKIEFDLENFDFACYNKLDPEYHLLGVHSLQNGLTFAGFSAGGDWESPVYFIIYWDGTSFRGYIPSKGNLYNKKTKQAYGNDEEADEKEGYVDHSSCNMDYDFQEMIKDITSRIQVK